MKNLRKAGLLLLLGAGLTACAGIDGPTPYQALENRMSNASTMGNNSVIRSTETLRCPAGMNAVSDSANVSNNSRVQYSENHGDGGGRSVDSGNNQFRTYNSASVRVQAESNSQASRSLRCVSTASSPPQ